MRRRSPIFAAVSIMFLIFSAACGDDKKDEEENFNGPNGPGGPVGTLGIRATADLSGAFGVLAVDNEGQNALHLMKKHNKVVEELGLDAPKFSQKESGELHLSADGSGYQLGDKSFHFPGKVRKTSAKKTNNKGGLGLFEVPDAVLQKIDEATGEIKDALTQEVPEEEQNAYNPNQKLPKITTIAVSPTREIFIHFERSFIYRDANPDEDPWNPSNGYQCQIFKVKGGTVADLLANAPSQNNLLCIDNTHFIDQWRSFNNGALQFDSSGNIYYPGSIPNTPKMVVYKRASDGTNPQEIINANICVQDFLTTQSGGVFYTGQTCQNDNHGGGGGGFFRYVAPGSDGSIIEIARDWWNFIFDAAVSETNTDTAVFFGPDPRDSSTASWDSACLFKFDPSLDDPSTRISEVITCGNNIWDWMDMRRSVDVTDYGEGYNNYTGTDNNFAPTLAWRKEYKRRCTTSDEVFAGGGSQISAIEQDSSGTTYVIGNIRKKIAGNLRCTVEMRGPHCTIDGMPKVANSSGTTYTSTSCSSDAGTWVNKGRCSDGSTDAACIEHSRTWTPGFCSNPDYITKSECEAAVGCWDNWNQNQSDCTSASQTWNNYVWQTGRCSSDHNLYKTQSTCEAAGKTWNEDSWSGSCTSTDSSDNAKLHNNDRYSCIPEWQTEVVWYENVTNELCTSEETGSRASWHDWDHKDNKFAATASSTHSAYTDLAGKFLVNRFECSQSDGGSGNWTTEYSALARVDSETKALRLLSLQSEKAIDLWLVNDKPYYSSFDTNLGQYLLSGLSSTPKCVDTSYSSESDCTTAGFTWSERSCVDTSLTAKSDCQDADRSWIIQHPFQIHSNFETYNLAESGTDNQMFADGLDFSSNQYQFGTIDVDAKALTLKQGLTGTVKTIVILPQD